MKNLFAGRLRWLLIFWMFLMSAIAYLDRVNVSIAGQAIQKDFNLSNVQLGYVFSAFVIGYALFQAPGGYLADKYGPRFIIAAGVVWWGIFTTATAWVPTTLAWSITILIVMRFLLGLGEAVVFPSSNRLVAAWIPSQERGLANGLIFAGVWRGRRRHAAADHLRPDELRLALVVLRLRHHRALPARSGCGSPATLRAPTRGLRNAKST